MLKAILEIWFCLIIWGFHRNRIHAVIRALKSTFEILFVDKSYSHHIKHCVSLCTFSASFLKASFLEGGTHWIWRLEVLLLFVLFSIPCLNLDDSISKRLLNPVRGSDVQRQSETPSSLNAADRMHTMLQEVIPNSRFLWRQGEKDSLVRIVSQ